LSSRKNLLDFVITQELLKNIGGEQAVDLVKICQNKKRPVTDEEISKKMKMKVTEIRTILNRLHYRGVAGYQKTRNQKTGWYSYTWEINTKRIAELLLEQQIEKIEKLEQKAELEKDYTFFTCKNNCDYLPFEIAAEYQFKCPVCNLPTDAVDYKKRIKKTQEEIKNIHKEINMLKKHI